MGKLTYTFCDGSCGAYIGTKKCWQAGHIPFAGYLKNKYYGNEAAKLIFKRYVRMKQVVWPEETANFVSLWLAKHPEIPLKAFFNAYASEVYFGAFWSKQYGGMVSNLFGKEGILPGEPETPSLDNRDSYFFREATKNFKVITERKKYKTVTRTP